MTLGHRTTTMYFLTAVVAANVVACAANDLPSAAHVQKEFETVLKVGDSSEKIEAFFKSRGLDASYDEYQNRYQCTMRSTKTEFHAISIFVNIDKEKRFVSVEAFDSYTMP